MILREDAVWSDGTPVTANDVKFTFDRAKNMPKTKSNTSKVKEVVVDNEHQVTIKLTEPYAPFKSIVANSNLSIVQEAAVTAAGEAYGDADNAVGSGPFTVKEWVPNDHYTLEKRTRKDPGNRRRVRLWKIHHWPCDPPSDRAHRRRGDLQRRGYNKEKQRADAPFKAGDAADLPGPLCVPGSP